MKLLNLIFLCLLVTTLYVCLQNINSSLLPSSTSLSSSSSKVLLIGRRCMEERVPIPTVKKGVPEERKIQEKSKEHEYESSTDHFDEFVYHIDYHGVTTHPTPTPKHPAP